MNSLATRSKAEVAGVPLVDVVMQAPALICVTRGPEHVIDTVNDLYLESIGGRDVLGEPMRTAFPDAAHDRMEMLDRVYATGEPVVFTQTTGPLPKDARNDHRFFNVTVQPLKDRGGLVYGLMTYAIDVTEEVRIKQELAELALALERSNRELDSFAYAASHDLRAPLRGIANLAQWIEEDLLSDGDVKSETREMLDLMRIRMHRMEGLIEGLLQYSRAGRTHQEPEMVDVGRLVHDVIDLISPRRRADHRRIRSERFAPNGRPAGVHESDRQRTAPNRGDSEIAIDARRVGPFYEFAVSDNGPGFRLTITIASEVSSRRRVRSSRRRRHRAGARQENRRVAEGTGVGESMPDPARPSGSCGASNEGDSDSGVDRGLCPTRCFIPLVEDDQVDVMNAARSREPHRQRSTWRRRASRRSRCFARITARWDGGLFCSI